MTTFNTSASGDSGGGTAASVAVVVPSGVLAGDVVLVVAAAFDGAHLGTLSASSNGTSPTLISQAQTAINSGLYHNGGLWWFNAAGTSGASSDVGKTITVTMSGGTNPFWSAALVAYTPTSTDTAAIDVSNIATSVGTGTNITTPSLSTGVSGDWALQIAAVATSANTLNEPASTTSRIKHIPANGIAADVVDSNGSVGAAGTSIGGGTYSSSSGGVWYVAWTVGLAPSSGAQPPPASSGAVPLLRWPLWEQALEVASYRYDVAPAVASPVTQTWRLMDGISGRPGVGSSGAQPPSAATANAGNLVNGTSWYVTQPGLWFQGYWWWVTSSGGQPTGPQKFALWSGSTITGGGAVVPGSVVTSGTLSAGWNYVPLPKPVQLSLYSVYIAATGVNGPYPLTAGQTASGDPYQGGWASGPIVAPSDGNGTNQLPFFGNGCSTTSGTDPSLVMPGGDSVAGNIYWLDAQITNTAPTGYNGSYRLWPNMFDADQATQADAAVSYVLATEFVITQPCVVNAIWYYVTGGQGASNNQWATSADIWRVRDQVRVATQPNPVWLKPSGGVDGNSNSGRWVYTQLPGTVTLQPGDYKVSVYNGNGSPNGWSAKRLGYWQAWNQAPDGTYKNTPPGTSGITNGPLYAPTTPAASSATDFNNGAVTEPGQSTFASGPPNQYPNVYVGTPSNLFQNYWVDIEVTPASTYQPNAPDLPQRIPHPQFYALLEQAAERRFPGINQASTPGAVTGATAALTFTAPAGTVSASSSVTGTAAALTLAAPAGSVAADGTIAGATAALTLAAAPGTAATGSSVTGVAAALTLAAPAGSVAAGAQAAGVTAAMTLTAPAGSVSASSSVTGVTAALALGAPAGSATTGTVIAGLQSMLTLAAPAGSVSASSSVRGVTAALALGASPGSAGSGLRNAVSTPTVTDPRDGRRGVTAAATSAPAVSDG